MHEWGYLYEIILGRVHGSEIIHMPTLHRRNDQSHLHLLSVLFKAGTDGIKSITHSAQSPSDIGFLGSKRKKNISTNILLLDLHSTKSHAVLDLKLHYVC